MCGKPTEPERRGLLQPVERLLAPNKVGVSRILETGRLCAVDYRRQSAMEESVLHVELVNGPLSGESKRENNAYCSWLDHRTESLREVHAGALSGVRTAPCSAQVSRRHGTCA